MSEAALERRPLFHNVIEANGKIWFWDLIYNALFVCDRDKHTAQKINLKYYQRRDALQGYSYGKLALVHDKIIAVPLLANEILIYNLKDKKEKYLQMDGIDWGKTAEEKGKFWDVVVYGMNVFLIGYYSSVLLKLNVETETIEKVIDLYDGKSKYHNVYFKFAKISNGDLIIPACLKGVIFIVDPITLNYSIKIIDNTKRGFSALFVDKNTIWLVPRSEGDLILWDRKKDKIEINKKFSEIFNYGFRIMGFIEKVEKTFYIFPLKGHKMIMFDILSHKVFYDEKINGYFISDTICEDNKQNYFFTTVKDNVLYAYNGIERCFQFYNFVTGRTNKWEIFISEEDYNEYYIKKLQYLLEQGCIIDEEKFYIDDYIKHIKNLEYNDIKDEKFVGNSIYGYVIKEIDRRQ